MEEEKNFVLTRLQELIDKRGWTVYRLAKESGLAYSSLNNIFVRNTIPGVTTLETICEGLQITISQFFEDDTSVISNLDMLTSDERSIINSYRNLSRSDKELLKAFLMGLNKQLPEISE